MIDNTKIDTTINAFLAKQCELVGVNPDEVDFSKDGWYREYTWTSETEEKFKKWAMKYLYKKFRWPKRKRELEVSWYLVDYGWRVEDV